jgi:hypothetical protein
MLVRDLPSMLWRTNPEQHQGVRHHKLLASQGNVRRQWGLGPCWLDALPGSSLRGVGGSGCAAQVAVPALGATNARPPQCSGVVGGRPTVHARLDLSTQL